MKRVGRDNKCWIEFMQDPNANAETLDDVVNQQSNEGDYRFAKAVRNLWTPGETITVSFSGGTTDMYESAKKYIMQDIQPNVSMQYQVVVEYWISKHRQVRRSILSR